MVWDDQARRVATKVIGTIESNMVYDAIYYSDPITIGFAQWYGTRARNLLGQMTSIPEYSQVDSSLRDDVTAQPESASNFWTSRYLKRSEGRSLSSVLTSTQGVQIQNQQFANDLNDYQARAVRAGMDVNRYTPQFIYFCQLYHQSPKYALQVLNNAGTDASLSRWDSIAKNHSWYRRFPTRLNTALRIINEWDDDIPGGTVAPSPEPDDGGDLPGDGGVSVSTDISHVQIVGDQIHIHYGSASQSAGTTVVCYPLGQGSFIPGHQITGGPEIVPGPDPIDPDNPDPEVPPPSDVTAKENALRQFLMDRIGMYSYSQGAGRDKPDSSGRTDCSALVNYAYRSVVGINIGSYTVAQEQSSKSRVIWSNRSGTKYSAPPNSIMQVGDLVFYRWKPYYGSSRSLAAEGYRVNHVEMYIGNNQTIGHGGNPRMGPVIKNHTNYANSAYVCVVKRVL